MSSTKIPMRCLESNLKKDLFIGIYKKLVGVEKRNGVNKEFTNQKRNSVLYRQGLLT